MHRPTLSWVIVAMSCVLVSCAKPTREPVAPASIPASPTMDTADGALYSIDARASRLHILAYRGGTLARFGHNHVISAESFSGSVWLHPELRRSGFEFSVPVQSLIVDDPAARAAEGEEFSAPVPAKDIEGTRKNMLRSAVLDGARYPSIKLRSVAIDGSLDAATIIASVTVKDVVRDIEMSSRVIVQGATLTASGEIEILQSEFGIKPFSIAFGALEVQDRLRLKFDIVARRAESS